MNRQEANVISYTRRKDFLVDSRVINTKGIRRQAFLSFRIPSFLMLKVLKSYVRMAHDNFRGKSILGF